MATSKNTTTAKLENALDVFAAARPRSSSGSTGSKPSGEHFGRDPGTSN